MDTLGSFYKFVGEITRQLKGGNTRSRKSHLRGGRLLRAALEVHGIASGIPAELVPSAAGAAATSATVTTPDVLAPS